jgi:hypothetical protein
MRLAGEEPETQLEGKRFSFNEAKIIASLSDDIVYLSAGHH